MSKKIAVFTPSVNIGGIERVLMTYAALLSERGYNVSYLICRDDSELISEISENISVHNLRTNRLRNSIWKLTKYLHKEKPDAIIVANASTYIVVLAKLCAFSRVKVVTSHHNYINNETTSFVEGKAMWRLYNLCNSVVAVSSGIKELLISNGVRRKKVHMIYNPIDCQYIKNKAQDTIMLPDMPYLLFVGRLSAVKNIEFLIRVYKIVRNTLKIKLVLVGDGPENNKLRCLVKELALENEVIFVGAVANPYPYINGAEMLILPSLSEAFPTVLLEGLFLGKTIAATPTPGAIEILSNGKFGYIGENMDDEKSFADLIEYAYNNRLDSATLINYVESNFDVNRSVQKMECLL